MRRADARFGKDSDTWSGATVAISLILYFSGPAKKGAGRDAIFAVF